ncbi:MAG: hypothetical protein ACRDTC_25255 [Pseudonocardiaceae bacterium]
MKVELFSATVRQSEDYYRDRAVDIPRPARPELIRTYRLDNDADGTRFVIGRDRGDAASGLHWPWTKLEPGVEEDTQLSREQLELVRRDDRWEIGVPPSRSAKRNITVQYWASERTYTLVAGQPRLLLDPSSHIGAVVRTDRRYYWAMFTTPPGPKPIEQAGPTRPNRPHAGHITVPFGEADRPMPLPKGWVDAIRVKFEPYLTWPMGWQPAPLPPRDYPPPAASFDLDLHDSVRAREQYENQVKKRVADTKNAARSQGFTARTASGIEAALLEWLVTNGYLTFAEHHCEWRR